MEPGHVDVLRAGVVESRHRAHVVACDATGNVVAAQGDAELVTFLRSSAKPFQAVALLASGAAERYHLTDEELALACGSHKGEPRHVEVATRMLRRAGLDEGALQCAAHAPRSASARETPLCNNCSGKHAGFLLAQAHLGGPPERYLEPDSPVQRAVRAAVEDALGPCAWGVDGCGAPTPATTLRAAARGFARLAAGSTPHLARLRDAMRAFPEVVSGDGGFDTDLMGASEDRLVAKGGAEGYQGVGDLATGVGLVVKIEDGDGARRAVASATVEALRQLSWLEGRAFEVLGDWWRPAVVNLAGRVVGEVRPVLDLKV